MDNSFSCNSPAIQYAKYVKNQQAALFIGAGVSKTAGYCDWKELLAPLASEIGVNINNINDYAVLAQYVVNEGAGNKSLLENHIALKLEKKPKIEELHHELSNLSVNTIWTTNYDDVLETAYAASNPDVKVGDKSLLNGVVSTRVTIYKMHGTVKPHPIDIIITQDDYEHYFLRYPLMCRQLTSDFATKSFLFIGFSFTDPNVKHNLSQLRVLMRGSTRTHFLVYIEPSDDYAREHELWLKDLSRYGIIGLPVRDYAELPALLRFIRNESIPRSVLISGSHDGDDYELFCTCLGREIAAREIILISGEGRNVTTFASEGAFNYHIDHGREYSGLIQLYRIPKFARRHANDRYRLSYRRQLTEKAQLAIIVGGQNGTMEEALLCVDRQIPILPVRWTGGASEEAWDKIANNEFLYMRNMLSEDEMNLLNVKPDSNEIENYVEKLADLADRLI